MCLETRCAWKHEHRPSTGGVICCSGLVLRPIGAFLSANQCTVVHDRACIYASTWRRGPCEACDADGLRSYVLPASTTSQPRERAQVLLAAGSPSRWRLVAELVDQDPHILRIVVRRSAQRHSFKTELIFVAMRIAIRRPARSDTLFVTSCARSGAVQYRQRLARCSRRRPLVAIGSRAISAR